MKVPPVPAVRLSKIHCASNHRQFGASELKKIIHWCVCEWTVSFLVTASSFCAGLCIELTRLSPETGERKMDRGEHGTPQCASDVLFFFNARGAPFALFLTPQRTGGLSLSLSLCRLRRTSWRRREDCF